MMCIIAAVLVSVMALTFGGLVSAYVHGISVIVLVEGPPSRRGGASRCS
ncbi:MAG: hypothetical protein M5U28_04350 [Sandaracinaceae bacterium]|nr:hypothetical protein [Sandaracinaceae bacterium]